tara:strand:+ start:377 stop:619 length:243 start_codon:yes stop_codon:yes gene_type:complete
MRVSAIEKGEPIPPVTPRNNKYSFHEMEVGDHFTVVDYEDIDLQRLRTAACNYGRRNDKQFITRKVLEDSVWVFRVWRTA